MFINVESIIIIIIFTFIIYWLKKNMYIDHIDQLPLVPILRRQVNEPENFITHHGIISYMEHTNFNSDTLESEKIRMNQILQNQKMAIANNIFELNLAKFNTDSLDFVDNIFESNYKTIY